MNTSFTFMASAFVDRVGWALLHSIWQIALIAGLFGLSHIGCCDTARPTPGTLLPLLLWRRWCSYRCLRSVACPRVGSKGLLCRRSRAAILQRTRTLASTSPSSGTLEPRLRYPFRRQRSWSSASATQSRCVASRRRACRMLLLVALGGVVFTHTEVIANALVENAEDRFAGGYASCVVAG